MRAFRMPPKRWRPSRRTVRPCPSSMSSSGSRTGPPGIGRPGSTPPVPGSRVRFGSATRVGRSSERISLHIADWWCCLGQSLPHLGRPTRHGPSPYPWPYPGPVLSGHGPPAHPRGSGTHRITIHRATSWVPLLGRTSPKPLRLDTVCARTCRQARFRGKAMSGVLEGAGRSCWPSSESVFSCT